MDSEFPVLSADPTPHTPPEEWRFAISGAVDEPFSWTWEELLALRAEIPTVDIDCVAKWTKLDTMWKGVSLDVLLAEVETDAEYVSRGATGDTRPTCRSRA